MPPPTPTCTSPARIAWSRITARAQPGGADLVDRLRGDLLGDAGLDLRLARGDLALTGLQHLAHHDVLDLLGLHPGALQRRLDRDAAELGGVERGRGHRPSCRSGCGRRRGSRSWALSRSLLRVERQGTRPAMVVDAFLAGRYRGPIVNMLLDSRPHPGAERGRHRSSLGLFEDEEPPCLTRGRVPDRWASCCSSGEAQRSLEGARADPRGGQALAGWSGSASAQRFDGRARAGRGRAGRRAGTRDLHAGALLGGPAPGPDSAAIAAALVEGTVLADYRFERTSPADRGRPERGAEPKHLDGLIVSGERRRP